MESNITEKDLRWLAVDLAAYGYTIRHDGFGYHVRRLGDDWRTESILTARGRSAIYAETKAFIRGIHAAIQGLNCDVPEPAVGTIEAPYPPPNSTFMVLDRFVTSLQRRADELVKGASDCKLPGDGLRPLVVVDYVEE